MPATPINIVEDKKAIQYTGSNSADIAALVTNTTTISETGGLWIVESPSGSTVWAVSTNRWVIYEQNAINAVLTTTEYENIYICNALCENIAPAVRSTGISATPTLTLNQTATVAVQLDPAMADSSYTAKAKLIAASGTTLQINSVTVVDADTVNVVVQNTGIVALSGNVFVSAHS